MSEGSGVRLSLFRPQHLGEAIISRQLLVGQKGLIAMTAFASAPLLDGSNVTDMPKHYLRRFAPRGPKLTEIASNGFV